MIMASTSDDTTFSKSCADNHAHCKINHIAAHLKF